MSNTPGGIMESCNLFTTCYIIKLEVEIPEETLQNRTQHLFRYMNHAKIPALLMYDPKNIYYHTEFSSGNLDENGSVALAVRNKILLIVDSRYAESAKALSNHRIRVAVKSPTKTQTRILKRALRKNNLETLCIEDTAPTHVYTLLQQKMKEYRIAAKKPATQNLRVVKDRYEIEQIRKASEIADRAFEELIKQIRPGISERVLSWKLEVLTRKLGADKLAFDPIIASGERAGDLHQMSSNKKLQNGEMILVTIGVTVNHYSSNMTRTIFLGRPTRQFKQRYKAVQRVQEKMLRRVRIGMKWENAYDEAYKMFGKYRFGKNYLNGLGHGIGLDICEPPHLTEKVRNDNRFKLGMVFTVAPGLYFPGWGGISIADTVVLTKRGTDRLTKTDKKLISLRR